MKALTIILPSYEDWPAVIDSILIETDQLKDLYFGHMPGCPFGNMAMELSTQDEVLRQKVDGIFRSITHYLRAAISDAVQNGTLPEVDEEATGEAMLGYLEGIHLLAKARNDPELIRRLGPAVKTIRVLQ